MFRWCPWAWTLDGVSTRCGARVTTHMGTVPCAAAVSCLEKVAVDNGFDRELSFSASEAPEWLTTLGWPRMKPAWGDDAESVNDPNYGRLGGARWIGQERATRTVLEQAAVLSERGRPMNDYP